MGSTFRRVQCPACGADRWSGPLALVDSSGVALKILFPKRKLLGFRKRVETEAQACLMCGFVMTTVSDLEGLRQKVDAERNR